ncbi:MAG: hypothetical protein QW328_09040 [Nitrososphaerota archaeon]
MNKLVQSVEVFEAAASLEDAIVTELKDALASLRVGAGLKAQLAPGTSLRVKRFTRRLNRALEPSRFTARQRGDSLYVERIG